MEIGNSKEGCRIVYSLVHRMSQTETESHHVPTELRSDREYGCLVGIYNVCGLARRASVGRPASETHKVVSIDYNEPAITLWVLLCYCSWATRKFVVRG